MIPKWLKRRLAKQTAKVVFNRLAIPTQVKACIFRWWEYEMAVVRRLAVPPRRIPMILIPSGVPWFDGLVSHTQDKLSGCPGGTWIVWTGPPGVGKTTAALVVLNGMCADASVEGWHIDFEMGRDKARQMYELFNLINIREYMWEPDPTTLLDAIADRARELKAKGRKLVVLVDSFKAFGLSLEEMKAAALRLKSMRDEHDNLIVMTINHKTGNKKKTEGPAAIPQWCDVVLEITAHGTFVYIATPEKNRWAAPETPGRFKLKRDPEHVFVISREPDFFSDNPMVQFVRGVRWPWQKKE